MPITMPRSDIEFLRECSAADLAALTAEMAAEDRRKLEHLHRWLMTRGELANLLRIASDTVDLWVRKGCPAACRPSPPKPSYYYLKDVLTWLVRSKAAVGSRSPEEVQRMSAETRLAESKRRELERSFVDPAAEVEQCHRFLDCFEELVKERFLPVYGEAAATLVLDVSRDARANLSNVNSRD